MHSGILNSEVVIPALDGYQLRGTVFDPALEAGNTIVLINSATGVRRRYYRPYAEFLAGAGMRVVTYDYRGIGDSRPPQLKGFADPMHHWGTRDFAGALEWVAQRWPSARVAVVGHSVGGQIAGLAGNNARIDAFLVVGSQSGYWGHWPVPARYRMALNWYLLIPTVALAFGYVPGRFMGGEDLPLEVALEWAAWGRRPAYLLSGAGRRWATGFHRLNAPIRALSFSDDGYAPRAAVEALLGLYTGAPIEHTHLTPADAGVRQVGHFGFFRQGFPQKLWEETAAWLNGQAAHAPSTGRAPGLDASPLPPGPPLSLYAAL